MNRLRLSMSVLKSNKLFSAALIIIYTLAMSLMVMLCFFSESVDSTFDDFLSEYGLPDAYITTEGTAEDIKSEIEDIDGVEKVCSGLVFEKHTVLPDGSRVLLRYISARDEDGLGMYDTDKAERMDIEDDTAAVSAAFARGRNLEEGDIIKTEDGISMEISAAVSTPETISVARDSSSWYDTENYGYVYITEEKAVEISGMSGISNQFRIYFEDGKDQSAVLDEIEKIQGLNAVSSQLFKGSSVERQISAGVDGAKALVTYLPGFIFIISILFATLFMRQIIADSNKKIALLRTLGFSKASVHMLFVNYSLMLTLVSAVLGGGLGVVFLKAMLGIYKETYDLPSVIIDGDAGKLLIVFAAVILIGVLSSLLCTGAIGSADPVSIASGNDSSEVPKTVEEMHINAFSKMALISIFRKRKRFAIAALCCIACLCLNELGTGIIISKNVGLDSLDSRIGYDLMAYCSSEEAIAEIEELECVKAAEAKISLTEEYDGETMRIETLSEDEELTSVIDTGYCRVVPEEYGIAVEEGFARRHGISAGDVISVDGCEIEVTDITREYLYPVMYISKEQAEEMGCDESNALAVSLKEGYDVSDFEEEASSVAGYEYAADMEGREKCARETLDMLDMPCVMFIAVAMLIGLVIIVNMNIVSIKERKREYATLKVLGISSGKLLRMSVVEGTLQFIAAGIAGIPAAIGAAGFVMEKISSVSQEYVFERVLEVSCISYGLVFIYILAGIAATQIYICRMNVLAALGDRE